MNPIPNELNGLLRREGIPTVFSLHAADGTTIAAFASSDGNQIAEVLTSWRGQIFQHGCVAMEWHYGFPVMSYGKERQGA